MRRTLLVASNLMTHGASCLGRPMLLYAGCRYTPNRAQPPAHKGYRSRCCNIPYSRGAQRLALPETMLNCWCRAFFTSTPGWTLSPEERHQHHLCHVSDPFGSMCAIWPMVRRRSQSMTERDEADSAMTKPHIHSGHSSQHQKLRELKWKIKWCWLSAVLVCTFSTIGQCATTQTPIEYSTVGF